MARWGIFVVLYAYARGRTIRRAGDAASRRVRHAPRPVFPYREWNVLYDYDAQRFPLWHLISAIRGGFWTQHVGRRS